jgi:hypothetical protein
MRHGQWSSGWGTLGLGVGVVVAVLLGGPPGWAQETEDPCDGFSGICRGQCDAALDQGCFENPDTRHCGKREAEWEDHACPGTPSWVPVKRVFVTSNIYRGDLGGLLGADAKCQALADAAGLGGEFKAWLSAAGPGNSAADRLTHATGPYVRVDGVQVAANWTDLVDGLLSAPISIDEHGAPVISGTMGVWTGTNTAGRLQAPNVICNDWLSKEVPVNCVFHGFLPPKPREGCHPIHTKPATQSTGRLPPNPQQSCHPSQALGALVGALRRRVVPADATGRVFVTLLSFVARDSPASWAAW